MSSCIAILTVKNKGRPLKFEIQASVLQANLGKSCLFYLITYTNRTNTRTQTQTHAHRHTHTNTHTHTSMSQGAKNTTVLTSSRPCPSTCNSLLPTSKNCISEILLLPQSLLAAIISTIFFFLLQNRCVHQRPKLFEYCNKMGNKHKLIFIH